jgi:hypothetical protein
LLRSESSCTTNDFSKKFKKNSKNVQREEEEEEEEETKNLALGFDQS